MSSNAQIRRDPGEMPSRALDQLCLLLESRRVCCWRKDSSKHEPSVPWWSTRWLFEEPQHQTSTPQSRQPPEKKKTELASRDASGPRQCPCGVCPSRGLRQPGERRQGIKACDTGKRRIAKGQHQNSPSTHPPLGTKGDWSRKVTETVQSGQRQIRISFLDSQS